MSDQLGIVITGASGRMGQMLIETVQANEALRLVGVTERSGHDWIGRDLGEASGGVATGVPVAATLAEVLDGAQVIIDFTSPAATLEHAKLAAARGVAHVIGTTGLSAKDTLKIDEAAKQTPIVRAGNMSLGVNLLVTLTQRVAAALDEDFDIEIVEAHHRHKVDAPSGTALMLGQAAADGRGVSLDDARDSGRDGITGARKRGDIGFSAIRGGDIVGEHDVIFAAAGERIVLSHLATDRAIFARGAVKAAIWAIGRPAGAYDMLDVLGMR